MSAQTLEEWLSDLHCGRLRWPGAREKSGRLLVDDMCTFEKKRCRRRRNWSIACRDCGEHFKPVENSAHVHCPDCLAHRRSVRQI